MKIYMYLLVCVILLIVIYVLSPFFIVSPGERGLLMRMGRVQDTIYGEGIHWKFPLIENAVKIDIKTQKVEINADAASKDLQSINAHIVVNFALDGNKIKDLYQTIGNLDIIENRVISPAIQEGFKATTAKYTAEQLITQRDNVSNEATEILVTKLKDKGISVTAFNIVNFEFSPEFNKAIELKVKAEQDALTEKNNMQKTEYKAQQEIITASGSAQAMLINARANAEAIKLQVEAILNKGGADYVKLKWIEKWDGRMPITNLGNSQGIILDLNTANNVNNINKIDN